MWKQRSRVLWLKTGDRNSKFSHAHASTRRCINRINVLRNSEGTWLKGPQLEAHIVDYFQSIFLVSIERWPMDFLSGIERRVTCDMEVDLSKPFEEEEEAVAALRQMHPKQSVGTRWAATIVFPVILACCGAKSHKGSPLGIEYRLGS